jgi:hypothetical protein
MGDKVGRHWFLFVGLLLALEYSAVKIVSWGLLAASTVYCVFFICFMGQSNMIDRILFLLSASVATVILGAHALKMLISRPNKNKKSLLT